MDLNDLRIVMTLVTLCVFIGIVAWAWARKNKSRFDEAALLPFQELPSSAQAKHTARAAGGVES